MSGSLSPTIPPVTTCESWSGQCSMRGQDALSWGPDCLVAVGLVVSTSGGRFGYIRGMDGGGLEMRIFVLARQHLESIAARSHILLQYHSHWL